MKWDQRACSRGPLMTEPTLDQSHCEVGQHVYCSGYTQDEADPESCFCDCHDETGVN